MVSLYFTSPNEAVAVKMVRQLLKERLAACANLIPGIRSLYLWKNKIQDETECLCFVKTSKALAGKVMKRIKELHPYQVPAILCLSIVAADADFLKWIATQTKGSREKIRSKSLLRRKTPRPDTGVRNLS